MSSPGGCTWEAGCLAMTRNAELAASMRCKPTDTNLCEPCRARLGDRARRRQALRELTRLSAELPGGYR